MERAPNRGTPRGRYWLIHAKTARNRARERIKTGAYKRVGLACVVDRPGYDARYREKYGRRQWHLCQTAWGLETTKAQTIA
jgi:hypothetical protein